MTGEQIRALRLSLGLTQEQLAERLEVDRNTVARWERGERFADRWNTHQLQQLAATVESAV